MLPKKTNCYRQGVQGAQVAKSVLTALALTTLLAGTSHAQTTAVTAAPLSARTRGGVLYDPALALNAVVTPKPTSGTSAPTVSINTVSFQSANGQTVPGLFVYPTGAKSAPTVILLHGLGGKKEDMQIFCLVLASKGYASLAIDSAGHGARPKIDGKAPVGLGVAELRTMVAQTVADLGHAVDFLSARPEVDPKRIGYLGISLGAIEGTVFVGDEPRIKTAVFWADGGNWGKLITTTAIPQIQDSRKTVDGGNASAETIEKALADVDPVNSVHAISPRPILFINGDKDTIVPVPCTDELIAAAGENKTRVTLAGGHIPDLGTMASQTMAYFEKNLKASVPSAGQ